MKKKSKKHIDAGDSDINAADSHRAMGQHNRIDIIYRRIGLLVLFIAVIGLILQSYVIYRLSYMEISNTGFSDIERNFNSASESAVAIAEALDSIKIAVDKYSTIAKKIPIVGYDLYELGMSITDSIDNAREKTELLASDLENSAASIGKTAIDTLQEIYILIYIQNISLFLLFFLIIIYMLIGILY